MMQSISISQNYLLSLVISTHAYQAGANAPGSTGFYGSLYSDDLLTPGLPESADPNTGDVLRSTLVSGSFEPVEETKARFARIVRKQRQCYGIHSSRAR